MTTTPAGPTKGPALDAKLRRAIDAYFEGRASPEIAAQVHEAIGEDGPVRLYFERRQQLAALDPQARSPKSRIGTALGFHVPDTQPEPAFAWAPWAGLTSAAALGAAMLWMVVSPTGTPEALTPDDGFRSRGSAEVVATLRAEVIAYRLEADGTSQPLAEQMAPSDELAFAYANPQARRYLMVWGVDDEGNVYWYHPAWTDPDANPSAVEVKPSPGLVELPEAIAHDLEGRRELKLFALLSDTSVTVRDIENALKQQKPLAGDTLAVGHVKLR